MAERKPVFLTRKEWKRRQRWGRRRAEWIEARWPTYSAFGLGVIVGLFLALTIAAVILDG